MVMVLEQKMINEIARIGRLRAPTEACGLMLPVEINGVQIIEIPNRSKKPHDSFEMRGSDMYLALERVFAGDTKVLEEMIPDLTAWHTHPGGGVGPSHFDLTHVSPNLKNLVVTLFNDGRPPLATWF